jgi:phosphatidylserine/phosphatidylglycerophosphate/cardiolipin synthase-like enzyme
MCPKYRSTRRVPFPTIEALTDASIVGGNKLEILQNGDGTFPIMLRDIQNAKVDDYICSIPRERRRLTTEFARSFAERCQAGIKVYVLFDQPG